MAAFSDDGPLAAGAALHTAAVVVSSTSSYMRGGGESQVEAEGQRSRAERSWRSKHWKKVKNQSPDLQSSKLAISLCIPVDELDNTTTRCKCMFSGFRYPAAFIALH